MPAGTTRAKTMTVAICSYQRREALLRLLRALDGQAREDVPGWEGVDVLVVVDGSTDGSAETARRLPLSLPFLVIEQPHSGLSTARNTCLEHAKGELVYFLDDDLIPRPGTVERHRSACREGRAPILLGPCLLPDGVEVPPGARAWWEDRREEMRKAPLVERFDHFSAANASGPVGTFREAGGFDTGFVGYGLEDHELGLRLIARGIYARYDDEAVAWHYTVTSEGLAVSRNREIGQNAVRLLRMHPEAREVILPREYDGPPNWLLSHSHIRSPGALWALASACQWAAGKARAVPLLEHYLRWFAVSASYAAGVADLDRSLVPAFLGRARAREQPRINEE